MPTNTITKIEKKFRQSGLDETDRAPLRSLIIFSQDISELESAIYIFAYSYSCEPEVEKVCERYCAPKSWEPGLTAVCLKALIRYWDKKPILYKEAIDCLLKSDEEIWHEEIDFLRKIKRPEYKYIPIQY